MPVHSRPDYTKQVLEGIKGCYGSDEYKIFIFIDPSPINNRLIEAINSVDGLNKEYFMNDEKLLIGGNVYKCLEYGFSLSDFVILFEDDIVPSKDCLRYFEWGRDTYEKDQDIFNITGYSMFPFNTSQLYAVDRINWFTCWGWGTWKDRWEPLKKTWTISEDGCWSGYANDFRADRHQIRPLVSRTQNIGFERGVHRVTQEMYDNSVHTPFWVDYIDYDFNANTYHEVITE